MPTSVPTHRPYALPRGGPSKPSRHRESNRFYASIPWLKVRLCKLQQDPLCEPCKEKGLLVAAMVVHHKVELRDDWSVALDMDNLMSMCSSCHSRLHAKGEHHR